MKKIRIAFLNWRKDKLSRPSDEPMYEGENNYILKILKKRYIVELDHINPEVVFHYPPSFLGSSPFKLDKSKINIVISFESYVPDLTIFDYAISLHRDFKYKNRVAWLPFPPKSQHISGYNKMVNRGSCLDGSFFNRSFCAEVSANFVEKREYFIGEIDKYKRINRGGLINNNINRAIANKINFFSNHKFSICIENSSNYVTEKIVDGFGAQTIPIYYGDISISNYFNPKAFINIHQYETVEELVNDIKKIDSNRDLYYEMLNSMPIIGDSRSYYDHFKDVEKFIFDIVDGGTKMTSNDIHMDNMLLILNRGTSMKFSVYRTFKKIIKFLIKLPDYFNKHIRQNWKL